MLLYGRNIIGPYSETFIWPSEQFWKSSEVFGKWSEIFGKSSQTSSLIVCLYNKHAILHARLWI